MHTFHFADVTIVFVFLDLDDCFSLVVDFRADVTTGILVILVLMENGMNVNLEIISVASLGELIS